MSDLSWLTEQPIAHRGYHDLNDRRWENTLSAFEAAVERGFAIECDVHLSADRVPVIIHDDNLQRLAGRDGFVWQRTAAELGAMIYSGEFSLQLHIGALMLAGMRGYLNLADFQAR